MGVCIDFTRRDGTGWAVELDALAGCVPGGMSRNRVKALLQKLVATGYLTETARTIGGRGVTARRSHDLRKPAPAAVQVSDETCTANSAGLDETRTASGSNPHQQRFKPAPAAEPKTNHELQQQHSLGTSIGTSLGTARCSKHADPRRYPLPPNCNGCKEVRAQREQDDQMRTEREQATRDLFARAQRDCATCRGTGQIDISDNAVARCPECRTPEARQRLLDDAFGNVDPVDPERTTA